MTLLCQQSIYSQSYGFCSSHVWMWELNHKEGWAVKNWCFQTVVLDKTLESVLDCKRSNQSILREINHEYSLEDWCWSWSSSTLATWCKEPTHWKRHWWGKDWRQEEKGTTETEMVGWHHCIHGDAKSQTRLNDRTEMNWGKILSISEGI